MLRALLLVLATASLAACGPEPEPVPLPPAESAAPAVYDLAWRESYPETGPGLRFVVERLRVLADGWSAEVAVVNDTKVAWRLDRRSFGPGFGLMLFADDDLEALEEAGRQGRLPPPRRARTLAPQPPNVLRPGTRWRGSISAPGALAAGAYARVVFGPLRAEATPPEGMQATVVWITDHARRLAGPSVSG